MNLNLIKNKSIQFYIIQIDSIIMKIHINLYLEFVQYGNGYWRTSINMSIGKKGKYAFWEKHQKMVMAILILKCFIIFQYNKRNLNN